MTFTKLRRFLLVILLTGLPYVQSEACYLVMVGKDASANGNVLLAHNNDLSGTEASLLIKVTTDQEYVVLPDKTFDFGERLEMLVLQTNKGYAEGDAVAINECGVAIAGGLSMKDDRNERAREIDPLIPTGLGGGIRYFALRYARSARECVQIIGQCYTHYGIAYPSAVGIADTTEIWYMEAGGGNSWAAVKIPADRYFVGANSYRIGTIDFDDTTNFIYSDNLKQFADEGNLNFSSFFGGGVAAKSGNNKYNTRRLWRGINLLSPEISLSPDTKKFPFYQKPSKKITINQCFDVLRDYYAGTHYSLYKSGKFNDHERAIACWNCVHTSVISLKAGRPVDSGATLWTGLGTSFTAIYLPVNFGIDNIPESYRMAPENYSSASAFWQFKRLGDLTQPHFPISMKSWIKRQQLLENDIIFDYNQQLRYTDNLSKQLNELTHKYATKALELVEQQLDSLASESHGKK